MHKFGRVKILDTAKPHFGKAGEKELFRFLDAVEHNCELFSRDHERAVACAIVGEGIALILPYHVAGQCVGDYRRKDNSGKIVPFGTQNWVHLGNLACELWRPPTTHSDHNRIKMRRFFPQRPHLTDEFLQKIAAADPEIHLSRLSGYLQTVRFNNV